MEPAAKFVWVDGEFRGWNEATVHVMTQTLHYGLGVFEGIRCYQTAQGKSVIFRLKDHVDRLLDSAKACAITVPYEHSELMQACKDVVARNDFHACYLRPIIYYGDGEAGLGAMNPVHAAIAAFSWEAYLGRAGMERGIRVTISSYARQHLSGTLLRAKVCGQYTTSVLAKRLAKAQGYDEALLLDGDGHLTEGTGENLFLVRRNVLKTPPERSAILPGITRDTILRIARDHASEWGLEVREETFARDELVQADEVFLTGTAAEVTPVREVDIHKIGNDGRGPITARLQELFFRTVRGQEPAYQSWLEPV